MPLIKIILFHHGHFSKPPNISYIDGKVEVIPDFDTDLLSFRDVEDFAAKFDYDTCSLVYYKNNGYSFSDGVRVLWDDNSVRDMVDLCNPFEKIELYVEHVPIEPLNPCPTIPIQETYEEFVNINIQNNETDQMLYSESETEDSSSLSDIEGYSSDEEFVQCIGNSKMFKENMSCAMGSNNICDTGFVNESDYDSDGLRSLDSSSEDENMRIGYVGPPLLSKKRKKNSVGATKINIDGKIRWQVGMSFVNMEEFRNLVREYGLSERRAVTFVTNDGDRCQVCCENNCPFYIWCSRDKNGENCTIKTLRDLHLCTKPYTNKMASVKYLNEKYGERIRKNPQWKTKEMIEVIRKELEIEVPKIKIARLRKAALEGVHESLKEHYSRIRDFAYEILSSNPNNKIDIRSSRLNEGDQNHFKRIYLCYHVLKEGWKAGCRPVISLDGCFLKTVCGGQLLSAIGRDGNNQMFPIAYVVVESENTESWTWFADLLKDDLNLRDGSGYTVISDQQKGLENALKQVLPNVEHRFCVRHLYNNFRKRFPSLLLRRAFWTVSCATHPMAHEKAMKQLERISRPAYEQMLKLDKKVWCKAHFSTHSKADNCDNNMSECFNAWIINERYMPLLTMLQEIHGKLLKRIRENRDAMLNSEHQLCPKIKKKLDLVVTESREWRACWDGLKKFQVKQGTRAVTVDLEKRTCDCRIFDLTDIPCAHAAAAIHDRRHNPMDYVSEYYKRGRYLATYSHPLEAIKGEEYWIFHSADVLLPPPIPKKLRGRPKRLRRKEAWEGGNKSKSQATQNTPQVPPLQRFSHSRKMHCSLCRAEGHRKNKCPTNPGGVIPCAHAVAAIHDRRHNPMDYVSEYYKRGRYLATYSHPLEAIKGEEYWIFHSADVLLPPPIPKKIRGRPKRLRRKEAWEGGNKSKSQATQNTPQVPPLQRFSHSRKMHCSLCRAEGHRKNKCPTNPGGGENSVHALKKKMLARR